MDIHPHLWPAPSAGAFSPPDAANWNRRTDHTLRAEQGLAQAPYHSPLRADIIDISETLRVSVSMLEGLLTPTLDAEYAAVCIEDVLRDLRRIKSVADGAAG